MTSIRKRSRYYPSDMSWTKTPAWAFEIPIKYLSSKGLTKEIVLECGAIPGTKAPCILRVPTMYFRSRLGELYIREEKECVSIFLSAAKLDRFTDLRGKGHVAFSQFEVEE